MFSDLPGGQGHLDLKQIVGQSDLFGSNIFIIGDIFWSEENIRKFPADFGVDMIFNGVRSCGEKAMNLKSI